MTTADRARAYRTLFYSLLVLTFLTIPFCDGTYPGEAWDIPCWYGLNVYRDHGLQFGRDIFSQYGPLSFLIKPLPLPGNHSLFWHYAFFTALHLALFLVLILYARRTQDFLGPSAILLLVFSYSYDRSMPDVTFGLVAMLCYLEDLRRPKSFLFLVPAVLAAVTLFAKFNLGVVQTAAYFFYLLSAYFLKKDKPLAVLLKLGAYLAVLAAIVAFNFSSPRYFWDFLRASMQFSSGYVETNASEGLPAELTLALVMIALAVPVAKLIRDSHSSRWAIVWLGLVLPFTFMLYKHAFIMQNAHVYCFNRVFIVFLSTALFLLPLRRMWIILLVVAQLSSIANSYRFEWITPVQSVSRLSGVLSRFDVAGANRLAIEKNQAFFDSQRLTDEEIRQIGNGTVEIVPRMFSLLAGTKLKWRPSPVFFYYGANTPDLDAMNVAHLDGTGSADYLLMNWESIHGVHPLYVSPATYFAVMNNYEFVSLTGDRLLLKKRPRKAFMTRHLSTAGAKSGESVPIPHSDGLVVAHLDLKLSWVGKIYQLLYRVPISGITLQSSQPGVGYGCVLWTGIAKDGLIVNRPPMGLVDVKALMTAGVGAPMSNGSFNAFKVDLKVPQFLKNYSVDFFEVTDAEKKPVNIQGP